MMELRGIEIIEGIEPLEVLGDGRASGVRYRAKDGDEVTHRHRLRVHGHR